MQSTALGRGSLAPSPSKNLRAGMSSNGSIGLPCETKTTGIWDSAVLMRSLRPHVRRLDDGEELAGQLALLARAEAGVLAAAERHVVVDAGGRQVDHAHASLDVALEVAGMLQRG